MATYSVIAVDDSVTATWTPVVNEEADPITFDTTGAITFENIQSIGVPMTHTKIDVSTIKDTKKHYALGLVEDTFTITFIGSPAISNGDKGQLEVEYAEAELQVDGTFAVASMSFNASVDTAITTTVEFVRWRGRQ